MYGYSSRTLPSHEYRRVYCRKCGHCADVPKDCGHRFCPTCAKRRSYRVRNRLLFILDNNRPKPGYILKMITLSTRNCQSLEIGVRHLVKSFRRLRQRNIWKTHVDGGATIIEVTGEPGNWHPHLHILCWCRRIDWKSLKNSWTSVSGGLGCYIINTSRKSACFYVTKYITKAEVPEGAWDKVGKILVKYRLFQRFGSWQGIKIPKKISDYPCPKCGCTVWVPDWMIEKALRRGS